jgi:uncharacterized protein YjbJ (UPF0337 family)
MRQARKMRTRSIQSVSSGKDWNPRRIQMTSSTTTTSSTHDRVEGKVHEVKGAVKEKVGQVTNNPQLQDEGTVEKFNGKVENKVGQVKKVFGK